MASGEQRNEIECISNELLSIDATVSTLEQRRNHLHRRLAELLKTGACLPETGVLGVEFYDPDLSISWNGGRLRFREGAKRPYRLFRAVWEAGADGLPHEEAAEILFGDQVADIKQSVRAVREKAEDSGFPLRLENDGNILRFISP